MQRHNAQPTAPNLTRAKRYFEARDVDPETFARVQRAIAVELLGPEIVFRDAEVAAFSQHRCLTSFEATQVFAKEFERALTWCASKFGAKRPKPGKYDLLFSTPTMFKGIWLARQVADELGIPYGFYTQQAVKHWADLDSNRMPRPGQLCTPSVIEHVMKTWADMRFVASPDEDEADRSSLDQPHDDLVASSNQADSSKGVGDRFGNELMDRGWQAKSPSDEALEALIAADAPAAADSLSTDRDR